MVFPARYFATLGKCQTWLQHEGFQCVTWMPLGGIFYRNWDRNPDQQPGVKLVVFDTLDSVLDPSDIITRSTAIFDRAVEFFRKKHRIIGSADNFVLFTMFPISNARTDLAQYFQTTKPHSNSFLGSQIPILMDLEFGTLHFFVPAYMLEASVQNKLTDQIEWLFLLPIVPEEQALELTIGIVNSLRGVTLSAERATAANPRKMSMRELKTAASHLYYEASTQEDALSVRKLLHSFYLFEYLRALGAQKASPAPRYNDTLDLASFTSLDQFSQDIGESLARTMASGFRKGFETAMKEGEAAERKKSLLKSGKILSLTFCHKCQEVVTLTTAGSCPKSAFHSVDPPVYFEIGEEEEIQSYRTNRRSK